MPIVPIHPRYERRRLPSEGGELPRERIFRQGAETLTDHELLAAVLGTGFSGTSVREVAANVLEEGTLEAIAKIPARDLKRFRGLGTARAAQLLAALEIGRRVFGRSGLSERAIRSPEDLMPLVEHFAHARREHFVAVLLNTRHRPIAVEVVSVGSLASSIVHPREVFRPAIERGAAALLLVHNHPSGEVTPSDDDLEITQRLVRVGETIGIEVLDHLILGSGNPFSMREAGLL
ncbi:MAG: DNA repair protein RadC [Candidatus Eisenbacteria bacterium]|uniref:DNA repair protein RadC n=1 Tax=Eiseniibacteriota bacterium TaxID=2212470 RepID=A0A956SCT5_UNCEI|nr:DNA repair protein RadC [Candidatus Eisenbacteria bacterium]MCB9462109.1 DNA repair protein RadC [Candidatus Eisenbacteria bacterium]